MISMYNWRVYTWNNIQVFDLVKASYSRAWYSAKALILVCFSIKFQMISGTQSVDLYSSTGLSLDLVCFHLGDISGQPVTFPKISGCQSEIQRLLWSPGCGSWCQWVGDHEGDAAMPLFLAMFSGNTVLLVYVHLFFHVFSHLKPAEILHVSSFSSVTRRCRPTGSWLRSTTLTRTLTGSGWKLLILFLACCFPPCPWRNDPHPLKMMPSSFGWYQFPSHLEASLVLGSMSFELFGSFRRKQQAEEEFKCIAEAYEALTDPEKRKNYDQFGKDLIRAERNRNLGSWKSVTGWATEKLVSLCLYNLCFSFSSNAPFRRKACKAAAIPGPPTCLQIRLGEIHFWGNASQS